MDSRDSEHVNNHSQGEEQQQQRVEEEDDEDSKEEEEDKLEQHKENGYWSSGWGAQRPIRYMFPESQPSLVTAIPLT